MPELNPERIVDWLRNSQRTEAPPAYSVTESQSGSRELVAWAGEHFGRVAIDRVVPSSRTVAFRLYPRFDDDAQGFFRGGTESLLRMCQAFDTRDYTAEEFASRDNMVPMAALEVTSAIDGLPVIGPGGRLTIYRERGRLSGEVTIRRHGEALRADRTWRDLRDVVGALQRLLDAEPTAIDADLGYFELSGRAEQTVLRPAYMFMVFRDQPVGEDGAGWAEVVVTRATDVESLGPDVGLQAYTAEEEL